MKNVNVSVNSAAKLSKRLLSAFIELFLVITTSYLLFTFVAIPIANKVSNYQANKEELVVETTKYYKIAKEEQYNIIKSGDSYVIDIPVVYDKSKMEEIKEKVIQDSQVEAKNASISVKNGKIEIM